jgi:hypothetical protein
MFAFLGRMVTVSYRAEPPRINVKDRVKAAIYLLFKWWLFALATSKMILAASFAVQSLISYLGFISAMSVSFQSKDNVF